jgi:hypothetical protein
MQAAPAVAFHVRARRVNDDEAHHAVGKPDCRLVLPHALHPEALLVELRGFFDLFHHHRDVTQLGHRTSFRLMLVVRGAS